MRTICISAALAASLMASTAQGQVRPGWEAFAARFDGNAPIILEGDIISVDWTRGVGPKVFLTLSSIDSDGSAKSWTVEGGFADVMRVSGFTPDDLRLGAHVSARGYRAKDGSRDIVLRAMTFAGGRRLFVCSSGTCVFPPQVKDGG
jgi:hypothetical protein